VKLPKPKPKPNSFLVCELLPSFWAVISRAYSGCDHKNSIDHASTGCTLLTSPAICTALLFPPNSSARAKQGSPWPTAPLPEQKHLADTCYQPQCREVEWFAIAKLASGACCCRPGSAPTEGSTDSAQSQSHERLCSRSHV
jgi:hypothetical protein